MGLSLRGRMGKLRGGDGGRWRPLKMIDATVNALMISCQLDREIYKNSQQIFINI